MSGTRTQIDGIQVQAVGLLTQIGIARELGAPTDKGGTGKLSGGYLPETNGVDDARIGQLGLGVDDAECDPVLEGLCCR